MKITDVRVRTIRTQKHKPFTTALGNVPTGHFTTTILEVVTEGDLRGAVACASLDDMCVDIILNQLSPMLENEDPRNFERIWQKLFGHAGGWRRPIIKGEVVRAMSVVDCALWDIVGKAADVPVYQLLGGFRSRIACYASGGHYYTDGSNQEELAELETEMKAYMQMGFRAVKMRVGRDIEQDCERAHLVREIIGTETQLLFDFDAAPSHYGGVPHAIKFMRALEQFDPFWFEDPLVMDDVAGMKKVTDTIDARIVAGESEQTTWGFRDLLTERACDVLAPNATDMCGGITEWRKIASLAHTFRTPIAGNLGDPVHLHCIAGVPNGLILEVFTPRDWDRVGHIKNPILMPDADGCIAVPDRPGLGIELDEEFIEEHII